MEIFLSREVAGHRIFPAIDILKSGTRKEELLIDAAEIEQIRVLRRALAGLGTVAAVSALIEQLQKYPTNAALLAAIKNHL